MISCHNLVKIYKTALLETVALQGLDLTVAEGEMLGIVGASGSGKTTLLNILGGLDRPSAGRVSVAGRDLLKLSDRALDRYRRTQVGFVWQQTGRNLIPYLTARENIELPMTVAGVGRREKRARSRELLEAVGLWEYRHHRPVQLSGGQQQRVAIAVALANRPRLLLADEPTGEVDSATARQLLELFRTLNRAHGLTVLIVTHDPQIARWVDRVVAIRDGKTSTEIRKETPDSPSSARYAEYVVLDSAGRLQLPKEYRERYGIGDRATLQPTEKGILIRPVAEHGITPSPGPEPPPRPPAPRPQPSAPPSAILRTENLVRTYRLGRREIHALQGVDLTVRRGQFVLLQGRSGSGKTTLLNCLGGLDRPTAGRVWFEGRDLGRMSERERVRLRRRRIGFVFQSFALLPTYSAWENIDLMLRLGGMKRRERRQRVEEVLAWVGLTRWADHRPFEMSGGQQQRLAVARAIAPRPTLILADEPTGELDSATGRQVLALLRRVVDREGITVLIASHDPAVEPFADRVYYLQDGRIAEKE